MVSGQIEYGTMLAAILKIQVHELGAIVEKMLYTKLLYLRVLYTQDSKYPQHRVYRFKTVACQMNNIVDLYSLPLDWPYITGLHA